MIGTLVVLHVSYFPAIYIVSLSKKIESASLQASGSQLAERLEMLLAELQGGENPAPRADPVSAAEHAMRSMHLDPLVEVGLGLGVGRLIQGEEGDEL